jgi:hypothetical protein
MIIIYNPAQLSITTDQITKGTIYPEYPGISVDSAGGKIGISGVSAVANPYTGSGVFAKFKFKVASTLATGTPINLSFDFDPNNKTKTTDSNVIERGTIADVLSTVTNGTYTVGTGNCAAGITASPSPLASGFGGQGQTLPNTTSTNPTSSQSAQYPVYQPNINQLPNAGLFDNTMALTAVGVILVVLGIAGLAML